MLQSRLAERIVPPVIVPPFLLLVMREAAILHG
jgi:hypothetical protein